MITKKTGFIYSIIYSGQILTVGIVSIVASATFLLGKKNDPIFLLLIFCGANAIYIFDRLRDLNKDQETNFERVKYLIKSYNMIKFLLYISLLVILIVLFYLINDPLMTFFTFLCFSLGFLYNLYLKGLSKKIIAFKNFFVPLSFSSLIILAAIYYRPVNITLAILISIFVYIRLFAAVAFYDIKDRNIDKKNKIKTLAVVLNTKTLDLFLESVNYISIIPLLIGFYQGWLSHYSLILVLLAPFFTIYHYVSKKVDNIALLSYVLCDGEYILWFPLLISAKILWN